MRETELPGLLSPALNLCLSFLTSDGLAVSLFQEVLPGCTTSENECVQLLT